MEERCACNSDYLLIQERSRHQCVYSDGAADIATPGVPGGPEEYRGYSQHMQVAARLGTEGADQPTGLSRQHSPSWPHCQVSSVLKAAADYVQSSHTASPSQQIVN